MRETAKLAVVLLIICAVATALLGFVNSITAAPIAEYKIKEAQDARMEVMNTASDITEEISAEKREAIAAAIGSSPEELTEIYAAKDESGQIVGYTIKVASKGFGGSMEVLIGIMTDGRINEVRILSHTETPGLGANATTEKFYGQYKGKTAPGTVEVIKAGNPADNQVLSISGATITSNAVTNAVNVAMSAYNELIKGE